MNQQVRAVASIILISSALCFGGAASSQQQSSSERTDEDFCVAVESVAAKIMTDRQAGKMMSEAVRGVMEQGAVGREPSSNDVLREFIGIIADGAFDVPRYSLEQMRKDAIVDIASDQYSQCIKGIRARKG